MTTLSLIKSTMAGQSIIYYKSSIHSGYYLYSEDDGTWTMNGAAGRIGSSKPEMKSTTAAPCPALCQEWLYTGAREGGPPWKKGDITVICKIHSQ